MLAAAVVCFGFGAPVARAAGCGPGMLGSATAWKDRNAIYDFVSACDWHDRCYGARGYGWDPVRSPGRAGVPYARDWCDSGFHLWMARSCDSRPARPAVGRLCHAVADIFHWLVKAFGSPWYRKADGHRTLARLSWP